MNELRDHLPPQGVRTRGTVLVVPGRGETARTYARFGARLAADGYRVRVLDLPDLASSDAALDRLAEQVTAAVTDLDAVRPLVQIGSDAGAAAVGALAARGTTDAPWWPEAVVLAGLPGYGHDDEATEWDAELDDRTHCPVHRAVLTADADLARGALEVPVPAALLDVAYGSTVDLPHLLLTGDSDRHADHDALARAAKSLPLARLTVVRGGHHDVLNDLQHRSVAAEVVTFLEALRDSSVLEPILRVESSAW
ncbi:MAG: hypothetical protein JWO88_1321 [Frankiales bacterium]|nr:hypothetical protein [Frankiales bacterium]